MSELHRGDIDVDATWKRKLIQKGAEYPSDRPSVRPPICPFVRPSTQI